MYPALHEQSVEAVLPTSETLPAAQAEHNSLPAAGLYVLAAHCMHELGSGPVYPAGQPPDVHWVLPAVKT